MLSNKEQLKGMTWANTWYIAKGCYEDLDQFLFFCFLGIGRNRCKKSQLTVLIYICVCVCVCSARLASPLPHIYLLYFPVAIPVLLFDSNRCSICTHQWYATFGCASQKGESWIVNYQEPNDRCLLFSRGLSGSPCLLSVTLFDSAHSVLIWVALFSFYYACFSLVAILAKLWRLCCRWLSTLLNTLLSASTSRWKVSLTVMSLWSM